MKIFTASLVTLTLASNVLCDKEQTANLLLFVADDLGYGDLGCFGNTTLRTPNIDRLAREGLKLTHSFAAEAVCTPSRAAFLTGRYPIRSGMAAPSTLRAFLFTSAAGALPANETTFAEIAKMAGYTTGFLGKWHQGWSTDRTDPNHPHPLNQGFDYFYGTPFSNMPDFGHPRDKMLWILFPNIHYQLGAFCVVAVSLIWLMRKSYINKYLGLLCLVVPGLLFALVFSFVGTMELQNSFFFRNYDLVEQPIHQPSVTNKLVLESQQFLQARRDDQAPFLLVVSWLHVKVPLITAPKFRGVSQHGRYGDAVEEMDWGVGQVLDRMDHLGLANNTLVFFTSDHGGSLIEKDWMGRQVGGYNGPFRGAKSEAASEGGVRAPTIIRWPGRVTAGGVLDEPVSLMDVLPTIASLLNVPLPNGVTLDGKDVLPLLTGRSTVSPHRILFHYCGDKVHAIRYRPRTGSTVWKLVLYARDYSHGAPKNPYMPCHEAIHLDPPHLFNLTSDPGEGMPLDIEQHQEVLQVMMTAREEHERSVQHVPSQFSPLFLLPRPWRQPCCNFPRCTCKDDKFKGMFDDW